MNIPLLLSELPPYNPHVNMQYDTEYPTYGNMRMGIKESEAMLFYLQQNGIESVEKLREMLNKAERFRILERIINNDDKNN